MTTRRTFLAIFAALPPAIVAGRASATGKPRVFASDGIAINGYDPVAYFTQSAPVPGDAAITSEWNGATFRFATARNKAVFDGDPETYAPRYGGYCAYAVSKGATAPTDPEAWTVRESRLYLNFSKAVRTTWLEDVKGNIAAADRNWPGVLDG